MDGTKYDLIEKDNRAGFEMDCEHKLVTEIGRGSCIMEYESVKEMLRKVAEKQGL